MILKLESQKNVSILIAKGAIEKKDVAVLFAGIKKLFRDGKNRLILELPDVSVMSSDDLRELVKLNLLAAELSGEIVLSSIDETTQTRIAGFSSPPFMRCFKTREDALSQFGPKADVNPDGILEKAPAPTRPISIGVTHPETAPPSMKDEFQHKEVHELGPLRKQIERLERENRALSEQLQNTLFTYRDPKTNEQWIKKVEYLETALEKLLQKTP